MNLCIKYLDIVLVTVKKENAEHVVKYMNMIKIVIMNKYRMQMWLFR